MSHSKEQFVGAWSLVSWRIETGGKVSHPFGEDAVGQILYTADGSMSATVSAASRALFMGASPRQASDAQKAEAFVSYFHYAGSWHLNGDFVLHQVAFSLNPSMQGSVQKRLAVFDGPGRLTLSAHEDVGQGAGREHILEWRKKA